MSSKKSNFMKKSNLLKKIRERNGYTMEEFAHLIGTTRANLYLLEEKDIVRNKYIEKIKHLLTQEDIQEMQNTAISFTNSIINQNQNNCTNYNNTQISQQNQNNINLPNITCLTDEMEPSIHINDILYYDENDKNITTQKKIFIITNTSGDDFIRTIYKNMEGKTIIEAENEKYKSLTRDNLDGFVIKGRVVYILKNV